MSSVKKLGEVVDVVIGVDTHVAAHAAAAVDARTGAVLAQISVEATGQGYAELVEFADQIAAEHAALRAWAIEGTGSHGRGLTVHLHRAGELVVELDRPERAKRRGGVKSDPDDAIRAAREALARDRFGSPRGTTPTPTNQTVGDETAGIRQSPPREIRRCLKRYIARDLYRLLERPTTT